jgi:hypothetical protein
VREFASSRGRLGRLGATQRVIYTLFLLFAVAGLGSAVLLYDAGPGWTLESVRRYYRGEDAGVPGASERDSAPPAAPSVAPASPPPTAAGPLIELPETDPSSMRAAPVGGQVAHPRSYLQILENTHQHLFMMPVFFLVLAHLFALTGIGRGWVGATIGLAAVGIAGHLAAPWLIRWVSGGWAWLMPVTLGAMVVGLGAMIVVPLTVMWWPGRPDDGQSPS